ncbi:MAG: hypothetical protein ACRDSH_00285 [Pseudonocardiaceae bacterium]
MHYEGGRTGRHHGDGQAERLHCIGRIIQPSTTTPPTVLLTELDSGTLILQGRPDGPRVYLSGADSAPLRRELARVFGRTDRTSSGGQAEVL